MNVKDKTDFSPNYHMWHTVVIRDSHRGDYNSQMQFNIKLPHIKKMYKIKKVGIFYGFTLELIHNCRMKDRITKTNKKVFIYPFQTKAQAEAEFTEIKIMRRQCLSNRRNFINKKKLEEQDVID